MYNSFSHSIYLFVAFFIRPVTHSFHSLTIFVFLSYSLIHSLTFFIPWYWIKSNWGRHRLDRCISWRWKTCKEGWAVKEGWRSQWDRMLTRYVLRHAFASGWCYYKGYCVNDCFSELTWLTVNGGSSSSSSSSSTNRSNSSSSSIITLFSLMWSLEVMFIRYGTWRAMLSLEPLHSKKTCI